MQWGVQLIENHFHIQENVPASQVFLYQSFCDLGEPFLYFNHYRVIVIVVKLWPLMASNIYRLRSGAWPVPSWYQIE